MEIMIVRHGDPDYKNDSLTEKGHHEAKLLARSLLKTPLDSIYASPMGRAGLTAKYTARSRKMNIISLDWLREISEPCKAGWAWDLPGEYILARKKLPDLRTWKDEPVFGKHIYPFYLKIAQGFDGLMESHGYRREKNMYRVLRSSDKRIALFCHKGLTLTLLGYLLHWPVSYIYSHCEISTTGVTRLVFVETKSGYACPQLQVLNDLSHLNNNGSAS